MNHRFSTSIGILAIAIAVGSLSPAAGQAPATAAKKTVAAKATAPPEATAELAYALGRAGPAGSLERRHQYALATARRCGSEEVLGDEEAGDFQAQLANDLSRDRRDGGRRSRRQPRV